jgi:hypothetical protein
MYEISDISSLLNLYNFPDFLVEVLCLILAYFYIGGEGNAGLTYFV